MALITSVVLYILSFWPWISALMILYLTIKIKKTSKPDPLEGLPEIKPHWFWGNNDLLVNFNVPYMKHYQRLKGLRYGVFYNNMEKRIFVLQMYKSIFTTFTFTTKCKESVT